MSCAIADGDVCIESLACDTNPLIQSRHNDIDVYLTHNHNRNHLINLPPRDTPTTPAPHNDVIISDVTQQSRGFSRVTPSRTSVKRLKYRGASWTGTSLSDEYITEENFDAQYVKNKQVSFASDVTRGEAMNTPTLPRIMCNNVDLA